MLQNKSNKNVKGEYVDLHVGQLLFNPVPMVDKQTLTVSNGQVVIEPKWVTVKITNVQQWTDGFLISL